MYSAIDGVLRCWPEMVVDQGWEYKIMKEAAAVAKHWIGKKKAKNCRKRVTVSFKQPAYLFFYDNASFIRFE